MNKQAALERFRAIPEKTCGEWRYRDFGAGLRTFLALPGGELVNDLGFEFALAISETHRVVYPAYPRAASIEELADGLRRSWMLRGSARSPSSGRRSAAQWRRSS